MIFCAGRETLSMPDMRRRLIRSGLSFVTSSPNVQYSRRRAILRQQPSTASIRSSRVLPGFFLLDVLRRRFGRSFAITRRARSCRRSESWRTRMIFLHCLVGSLATLRLYSIATNQLVTIQTPTGATVWITGISVLPNGDIDVVWSSDPGNSSHVVLGTTLHLPGLSFPMPSALAVIGGNSGFGRSVLTYSSAGTTHKVCISRQ